MLDRAVIEEFLDEEFDDLDLEIPEDISRSALVETFCQYAEDDYYEWLRIIANPFLITATLTGAGYEIR